MPKEHQHQNTEQDQHNKEQHYMKQDHVHRHWMKRAMELAEQAQKLGEVPIGAVVVKEERIIGEGYNRKEVDANPLAHAELLAIRQASRALGGWRLQQCTLYVTLEPCPMCAGAIVQSRVDHLVYATPDPKSGFAGSLANIVQDERLNHRLQMTTGVYEEECRTMLRKFFQHLRR